MINLISKGFSKILILLGTLLLIAALIWWQQSFGFNLDFIKCLALKDGICRISGMKSIFGGSSYNPLIFWSALVSLILGIILKSKSR